MYHIIKDNISGQLVFIQDMILSIKYESDWRYIRQRNQVQIEKDVICENSTRIYHYCRVIYQVLLKCKSAYKY